MWGFGSDKPALVRQPPRAPKALPGNSTCVPEPAREPEASCQLEPEPQPQPQRAPATLHPRQCAIDGPHSPRALTGITVYLQAKSTLSGVAAEREPWEVGPEQAGPYQLTGLTREGQLVYFLAYHRTRKQYEWVIGPSDVATFAATVDLYAGAAARMLPGSRHVVDSQADGADAVRDPASVIKRQAQGTAPWQQARGNREDGLADLANGGASGFNVARNSYLRVAAYARPARQLANRLAADMASGALAHLDARQQAVSGRNALLEKTRARLSPGSRSLSRALKDEGASLPELEAQKTRKMLGQYRASAATRRILDADSELWAKYSAVIGRSDDAMRHALRALSQTPEVSRSLIASAGRPNSLVTGIAKIGIPLGAALGAIGAIDMLADIRDDVESQNWHAAAGEFAGFAGGALGGELGVMGAVWFASLIVPGAGAGVVLVVSLLGSIAGGVLGAKAGTGIVDALADGAPWGGGMATGLSAAGGFAGVHSEDHPTGYAPSHQAADLIFDLDQQLDRLATAIPAARDRRELEALQRMRLQVLTKRQHAEDYLTSTKLSEQEAPTCEAEPEPDVGCVDAAQ